MPKDQAMSMYSGLRALIMPPRHNMVACGPFFPSWRLGNGAAVAADAGAFPADAACVIIAGAAASATGRVKVVLRKCRREVCNLFSCISFLRFREISTRLRFPQRELNPADCAALDRRGKLKDYVLPNRRMGAHWFRPGECARGGMPRMVRWPR